MGFNWNFKPRTIKGFDSQPVDTLNPQVQPQPIQMAPVGLRGNETWRNQYNMPQTQRAAYMDEYEADQKWNEQPAELMQKADDGRISALENEIATLRQRIQENTAKLNNWTGNADQIAAIEARKINRQDPTSIWRWKVERDAATRLAAMEKEKNKNQALTNAQYEINNTLSAIRPNAGMDSPTQQRFLQQLADLKTMAQKNGLPTDSIDAKISEVLGEKGDNEEQTSREAATTDLETLLSNPNLSVDLIDEFEQTNPNLSRADWGKLDNKKAELVNKANKKVENEVKAKAREAKILKLDPNSADSDEIEFMKTRGYKRITGDKLSDTKWVKVK